jgi:glycerol-3-phosphate dehydrogenase
VQGLVSLVGIRFTTARADAARALDLLLQQYPHPPQGAATDRLPLPGGNIDDFAAFEAHAQSHRPAMLAPATLTGLLHNHGSRYMDVIGAMQDDEERAGLVPGTNTALAEIDFAIEHEMAVRLEDVVLRRTDIAGGGHPGNDAIEIAAATMARRLDWSKRRLDEELAATYRTLARHLAREPGLRKAAQDTRVQSTMAGADRRPLAEARTTYRGQREDTRPSAAGAR